MQSQNHNRSSGASPLSAWQQKLNNKPQSGKTTVVHKKRKKKARSVMPSMEYT